MNIENFIKKLKEKWPKQFVAFYKIKPKKANFKKLSKLHPLFKNFLKKKNIISLYGHQVETIEMIRKGYHTALLTPSASGKTLTYNIPVIETILKNPEISALYLFPTKALAQDQAKNISDFIGEVCTLKRKKIKVEIFDGDTPASRRKKIKKNPPNILISNPDMLHLSLLAHHEQWANFLKNLKFIIVDETHYYRGIIGAHFSQIIRRFNRILKFYKTSPKYLVFSATLANPSEFLLKLFGIEFKIINKNDAPSGEKNFIFWLPQASAYQESKNIFIESIKQGFKTIVFTKSRKITELIYTRTISENPNLLKKISAYRAGYLPQERREIEQKLFNNQLLGVIATSALELGIDIGELDVCILVGYPGTLISTWQRIGRVGRGQQPALVILVGLDDALDHYFLEHPRELFERPFEAAQIDTHNFFVVSNHLLCASKELPLNCDEPLVKENPQIIDNLVSKGSLFLSSDGKKYYGRINRPHQQVNLRSIGPSFKIKIADTGKTIGQIEYPKVLNECYPGAIYLHAGSRFQVVELNLNEKFVSVLPSFDDYYTEPRTSENVEIIKILKIKEGKQGNIYFGEIRVTELIHSFVKKRVSDGVIFDEVLLELDPYVFETKGIWFEIPKEIFEKIIFKKFNFIGGLHATEHALIGIMPIFILCDRFDLGGVSYQNYPDSDLPLIFIYDAYPGGIGLTEKAFEIIYTLTISAAKLLKDCSCEKGCPGCIQSPKCGNGNQPLDKRASFLILNLLKKNFQELKEKEFLQKLNVIEKRTADQKLNKKILFFDLETQNLFSEVGGPLPQKLKMSVGVLYDSSTGKYQYFDETEVDRLIKTLSKAELVVGFNINKFDLEVLKNYSATNINKINSFDILDYIYKKFNFRVSLDTLSRSTLGYGKTANGLQAVEWFRRGEINKLFEYCRKDVEIIKDLYEFGKKFKYLLFEKNNQLLRIPVEW